MMPVSKSRLYRAWLNMKNRCLNEKRRDYQWYGARGITVCQEWQDSFPAFEAWAMANGYREDLTLDRIETDGHYCPENCRWATRKVQANNRRTTRLLTLDGRTQSLQMWADELGIDKTTLWRRLDSNWTMERALTEPVHIEKRSRGLSS